MSKSKILLFVICVLSLVAFSQDLSKLTPEQLEMYKKYMESKGSAGVADGMKSSTTLSDQEGSESVKRKNPLGTKLSASRMSLSENDENDSDEGDDLKKEKELQYTYDNVGSDANPNFGSYLFRSKDLKFETNLNLPTPANYVLGTNDELTVDISGLYDVTYKLRVSPEGVLRIPNITPVKVGGLTVEAATRLIKAQVGRIYQGVGSGDTQVRVSLSEIRSIHVIVIGEAVRPGTYTLPSLATPFNALYACGGPNTIGTMRAIKIVRNGKVIATLDAYKYLTEGVLSANFCLQDQDVIQIDPYKVRVKISGFVKRPGFFEGLTGEKLDKLISYAGGFNDEAYHDNVTVLRYTKDQKTVVDINEKSFSTFEVKSGDEYVVSQKKQKYDNRVDIRGSVNRAGTYALETGLTIKRLIEKAAGVKEDAYLKMATIIRKQDNQVPEIISFNLEGVLNGTQPDLLLKRDDVLEIKSLFEFREGQNVTIHGAVRLPGNYPLLENITLKDLIYKAQGFTQLALTDSVELVRSVKDPSTLLSTNQKSVVYKFSMDKDMNLRPGFHDILLEDGDQVIVRTISGYEGVRMVNVGGEVLRPGTYNIMNKSERISDVIQRAGGLSSYAYPLGAFLIRKEFTNTIQQELTNIVAKNTREQLTNQNPKYMDVGMLKAAGATSLKGFLALDSIQNNLSGAQIVNEIYDNKGLVNINLASILKHPRSSEDLILEEGDMIYIPREMQTVKVIGEVLFPTFVRFEKGMSLKDYVNSSGGFSDKAQRSKIFVIYPNGSAKSTKRFLGFRFYPRVQPGSKILVPQKPVDITNKLSTAETISILTSMTSAIALVYSILR